MAEPIIYEENGRILPLEKYFPNSFKIHDYNPTENKIIKISFLDDDIKNWLRHPANKQFVFQCLLCCQEMTFNTVFLRGDYVLNRSHLLTQKHINHTKNASCVGVLLITSQKFIMCPENVLNSRQVFNVMKTVKRKKQILINNHIRNRIFCSNYSIFTFDNASKSLSEFKIECDIVTFMINYIRPLFNFHCLQCNKTLRNFTEVVQHLGGIKHIRKLKERKGAIISIRDFNLFIACNLEELSSFLFLDHLNSYLEEIVIASSGTVIISGCHSKENKQDPKEGEIKINVNPIELPNGAKAHKSIKVTTRYNNALTNLSENEILFNKLATSESRVNMQENVTIYEYSNQDFEEHCMDNIIHSLITLGSRIWCSRCRKGIFTLPALRAHLSSGEHIKNMRSNEQVGFMCHVCKIFFIELKGESLVHMHSSYENRNIIANLSKLGLMSIGYSSPLNDSIIQVYGRSLNQINEAFKFCCLACNDIAKPKLMDLGYHEISTSHKNLTGTLVYTYCKYCNVIYIDTEVQPMSNQFKLHFAKHLNDSQGPISYQVHHIFENETVTYPSSVNNKIFLFQDIVFQANSEPFKGHKLKISSSRNFTQFKNPGVCSTEFENDEKWDNNVFFKYFKFYESLTDKEVKFFECNICNLKKATKSEILKHLFISGHQLNQLYEKGTFLKICDLCDLAIFSGSVKDLQQHFITDSHIKAFSKTMGWPDTVLLTFNKTSLSSFMNMSKDSLSEEINSITLEMKENYINHQKTFDLLTKDILALMAHKFPDLSVTFYGSRVSGLATIKSDFDIFLDLGNEDFFKVKDLLDTKNSFFKFIVCISDSTCPIIQAEHKTTGYMCEFNLNNPRQHVETSKIIKILYSLDERVLWLLAAVKQWSIATKIRGTAMFSSHAITWLVLFYLMQPDLRIIPNVSFVIDQCGGLDSNGDEDFILRWKSKINKDKTGLELLEGFFNYYSLMKFSEYKLFPSSGLAVPRIQGAKEDDDGRPMFMQDPFYKERNILFNSTKEKSEKLTAACYLSLHLPWRL